MAQKFHRIYPFFKNGRFLNYAGEKHESVLKSVFMMLESLLQQGYCLKKLKRLWVSQPHVFEHDISRVSNVPLITWAGHATFIIQVAGLTIATDPIFGDSTWPFRRMTRSGISWTMIPSIDVVVISHNHPDHLNKKSIEAIVKKNPKVQFLVPLGDKQWFEKQGIIAVNEYTWWDYHDITSSISGSTVRFSFLPAHHWSGRGLFDYNKSLWGSWMIQSPSQTIYFAGDTAYGNHFKAIRQEFKTIDIALMPIGPCEPKEDTQTTHVTPEQSGQAFLDLDARCFVPMHWGVFWFGIEHPLIPVERIIQWWSDAGAALHNKKLVMFKFGESIAFEDDVIMLDRGIDSQKELQS